MNDAGLPTKRGLPESADSQIFLLNLVRERWAWCLGRPLVGAFDRPLASLQPKQTHTNQPTI